MYEVSWEQTVIPVTIWWLFRENLAVCKQAAQKFEVEKFNLSKLNELEVRK